MYPILGRTTGPATADVVVVVPIWDATLVRTRDDESEGYPLLTDVSLN